MPLTPTPVLPDTLVFGTTATAGLPSPAGASNALTIASQARGTVTATGLPLTYAGFYPSPTTYPSSALYPGAAIGAGTITATGLASGVLTLGIP